MVFSDNPKKHKTLCLETDTGCTVDDVIRTHDETQEEWEERLKVIRKELNEDQKRVEDCIQDIYTMLAVGKEDMVGIRKHMKKVKHELIETTKKQEAQIKRRDTLLNKMDKKLDTTLVRLDYKREGDQKRNGKLDKLDEEEVDHEKRLVALETEMRTVKDISSSTLSLLKAIGVGFVLFFITFFIKTFIWGF